MQQEQVAAVMLVGALGLLGYMLSLGLTGTSYTSQPVQQGGATSSAAATEGVPPSERPPPKAAEATAKPEGRKESSSADERFNAPLKNGDHDSNKSINKESSEMPPAKMPAQVAGITPISTFGSFM